MSESTAAEPFSTTSTDLGRVTRDIAHKIWGDAELESVFAHPLTRTR
jgi:hypothetical protein